MAVSTLERPMPDAVDQFLKDNYKPAIKRAVELIPSTYKPKQRGYTTDLVRTANLRLEPHGLALRQQYFSDWRNGRKANRGGLDLQSTLSLALAVFPGDVNHAYALLALFVSGVWDPNEVPEKEVRKLLENGLKPPDSNREWLQALRSLLEQRFSRLETLIREIPKATPSNPVTVALQSVVAGIDDLQTPLLPVFGEDRTKRFIEIVEGKGEPISSDDWPFVAIAFSLLTGDTWDVPRVKSLLTDALDVPAHRANGHRLDVSL